MIGILVGFGSELDAIDEKGNTPLMYAIFNDYFEGA